MCMGVFDEYPATWCVFKCLSLSHFGKKLTVTCQHAVGKKPAPLFLVIFVGAKQAL